MNGGLTTVIILAGAGSAASALGAAVALWTKPTPLFFSIAVGFAAGVLFGTFAFEMMPRAEQLSSIGISIAGFAAGCVLLYGLDRFVRGGAMAGRHAGLRVRRSARRGDVVTVLGGGTVAEQLVEGIAIAVSAATDPSLAVFVAAAIAIDNAAESLSVGELAHERGGRHPARRTWFWASLFGTVLFVSAVVSWFLLRGLSTDLLGFLLALGAGGMFYLTVTQLVPEAESHHINQSAAFAMASGFLIIFALSRWG